MAQRKTLPAMMDSLGIKEDRRDEFKTEVWAFLESYNKLTESQILALKPKQITQYADDFINLGQPEKNEFWPLNASGYFDEPIETIRSKLATFIACLIENQRKHHKETPNNSDAKSSEKVAVVASQVQTTKGKGKERAQDDFFIPKISSSSKQMEKTFRPLDDVVQKQAPVASKEQPKKKLSTMFDTLKKANASSSSPETQKASTDSTATFNSENPHSHASVKKARKSSVIFLDSDPPIRETSLKYTQKTATLFGASSTPSVSQLVEPSSTGITTPPLTATSNKRKAVDISEGTDEGVGLGLGIVPKANRPSDYGRRVKPRLEDQSTAGPDREPMQVAESSPQPPTFIESRGKPYEPQKLALIPQILLDYFGECLDEAKIEGAATDSKEKRGWFRSRARFFRDVIEDIEDRCDAMSFGMEGKKILATNCRLNQEV